MKFSLNKRKAIASTAPPEQQMPSIFMDLPVELQRHIITEFLNDLDTTFDDIKTLRLVCRRFDAIVAPRVYSRIEAFGDDEDIVANVHQLLALLSSKPSEQLHATTTLTMSDWTWIDQTSPFITSSELPLYLCILVNPVIAVSYYLIRPVKFPQIVPIAITNRARLTAAKLKLYVTPRFNLPNLTHVRWNLYVYDRKWVITRIVKVLQHLPQLSELSLFICEDLKAFDHLVKCVSKLHNLRKLKLGFYYTAPVIVDWEYRSRHVNAVGKIIAANPNLTHLEVVQNKGASNIDFGQMLRYVPAGHPLKLEHIALSHSCWNTTALIPHVRSLKSIYIPDSRFLKELLQESIFPPTVEVRDVDELTIEYLKRHPRIVSLMLSYPHGRTLLDILSRHSRSLAHFCSGAWSFYPCFGEPQNEAALLQCTSLKEIIIYHPSNNGKKNNVEMKPNMETALSVISRLSNTLKLVITEAGACEALTKYCSESQNPLLRDLARRIICEVPADWYWY